MSFFTADDSEELKTIARVDEEYETIFSVDATGIASALDQFKKVILTQYFTSKNTDLEFSFIPNQFMDDTRLGEGVAMSFFSFYILLDKTDNSHSLPQF